MKKCMRWRNCLLFVSLLASGAVQAYPGELHQQLTFLAAKQVSRCDAIWSQAQDSQPAERVPAMPGSLGRLSALDMRYVVRANVARSKSNFFARMFRWNYFDVSGEPNDAVLGMFDTRFNSRFVAISDQLLNASEKRDRLEGFGEVLSFLQDVSTPSRVVPVFTGRWWAFSLHDRFDRYSIDESRLEKEIGGLCQEVAEKLSHFDGKDKQLSLIILLGQTARNTMAAVNSEIVGLPASWTSFWRPSAKDPGRAFGEYGVAGNEFGNRVEFRCGTEEDPEMRCLLLKDDPLYQEFAFERHREAVSASMIAMLLVQRQLQQ